MTAARRRCAGLIGVVVLPLAIGLLAPTLARAQDEATATPDSAATAAEDSLKTNAPPQHEAGPGGALVSGLRSAPQAGITAKILSVLYSTSLQNDLQLPDKSRISNNTQYSFENYRKQDRTVEIRGTTANYNAGDLLPLQMSINGSWNWSQDITTNNAGYRNLNKRDNKSGTVNLSKIFKTGDVKHSAVSTARLNRQRSQSQNQPNNVDESAVDGALRSGLQITKGVALATRFYATKTTGTSQLGYRTSPSSANGDTLGTGVYYTRRNMFGSVVVSRSSFDKHYLDFRRNTYGAVDTTSLDSTVSKIVNELEQLNAVQVNWTNTLQLGSTKFVSTMSHHTDSDQYRENGLGRREHLDDKAEFKLGVPVGVDSIGVRYVYEWKWDDQRLKGAASNIGRQITKDREFYLDWVRPVFSHSRLIGAYSTSLSQDFNENPENLQDRDRLADNASLKLASSWSGGFSTALLFQAKTIHEIAIRATSSANNSVKKTYEIAPSYTLPISRWLTLGQTYRLYIQYQDYDFAYLPTVNKTDNYNKRGNVTTTLKIIPSERVTVDLKYDTSAKYNATRISTDATGRDFYHRDQEQWISRVDLGVTYDMTDWLTLQAATYRSKDRRDTIGNTTQRTDTYSGEIWLGATIDKAWGETNPLILAGRIKKYQAYGPNVTETNRDYWDADVSLKWSF